MLAQSPVSIAYVLMAGSCYLSFMWASRFHFRVSGSIPFGSIAIFVLTQIGCAAFVYEVIQQPRKGLLPILLYGIPFVVFAWAMWTTHRKGLTVAFSTNIPSDIILEGPYKFVRHPFYSSYLLFWIANACSTTSLVPWGFVAVMAAIYTAAAKMEEEKFSISPYRADYEKYKAQVGMFVPQLT
jgi:protein-S-isoprenylcysteine O-methyltransferase Ste14